MGERSGQPDTSRRSCSTSCTDDALIEVTIQNRIFEELISPVGVGMNTCNQKTRGIVNVAHEIIGKIKNSKSYERDNLITPLNNLENINVDFLNLANAAMKVKGTFPYDKLLCIRAMVLITYASDLYTQVQDIEVQKAIRKITNDVIERDDVNFDVLLEIVEVEEKTNHYFMVLSLGVLVGGVLVYYALK